MSKQRLSNKSGQILGRKGLETRGRLMDAARRLLETLSPFDLTMAAIAKEAETAAGTVYLYFDDVPDLMLALSEIGDDRMTALLADEAWLADPATLHEDAERFIDAFKAMWDRHSPILLYRNLEADRGDLRFLRSRTAGALPVLDRLCSRILGANASGEPFSRTDAYAEAVVIYAAVERLAASTHLNYSAEESLSWEQLRGAQARVIARTLQPLRS